MGYKEKGLLVVLSGPSGVGKGTVCKALRSRESQLDYSISATTRKPRAGEQHGVEYFFKTKEEFQQMIDQNQLLEWAEYAGNYYGTPLDYVQNTLESGQDVILEIEVQGAMQVKKNFAEGLFIFLAPPSLSELKNRIEGRGTETAESIAMRLSIAKEEIEMMSHYDYVVENDQVTLACDRIEAIVTAEHCKRERVIEKYKQLTEVDE
ncbi:guanylate kinase [Pullulanibacillus sp. KACC 23026]|uniref:guanylate kinase n=1 Tax=Pullulanibacillus sp. KACC 23026 TaxID=3028315 RepID=UPI0023AFDA98|nr:guanylate kinase [Pullulanibacillus sp. KACC 23026]WEG15002.1 guanylate kinase [Pullulanibacillus sp. KACC 23026]